MEKERIEIRKRYTKYIATSLKLSKKKDKVYTIGLPSITKDGSFMRYYIGIVPLIKIRVRLKETSNISILLEIDFNGWITKDIRYYTSVNKTPNQLVENFGENWIRWQLNKTIYEDELYFEVKREWDKIPHINRCEIPTKFLRKQKLKRLI